jgi:hypothetical protein
LEEKSAPRTLVQREKQFVVDRRVFVSSWFRPIDSERAVWPRRREAGVTRGAAGTTKTTKKNEAHETLLYKKFFVDLRAFVSSWFRRVFGARAVWPTQ